MHNLDTVR